MTAFLASVRSAPEAQLALAGGADVIDVKEPGAGALGAAAPDIVRAIVRLVAGQVPVSATIGDDWLTPSELAARIASTAACGVDIVKVGLAQSSAARALATTLEALTGVRVFAVVMADCALNETVLPVLGRAGVQGVMLDTADKSAGALPELVTHSALAQYLARCRTLGLETGLAGRLRACDVPGLLALQPDYLGFRSALCPAGVRTQTLDRDCIALVRSLVRDGATLAAAAPGPVARRFR